MYPESEKDYSNIKLVMDDAVANLIRQRHIGDAEVQMVIQHGESTGEKLYQLDNARSLSKHKILNAMYYVEYSPSDKGYVVHTAYAHRSALVEGK